MSATQRWSALAVGVVFGFLLTASGLGNYRTIHDGLLLRDPYIYLMMASTVATAGVGLALLAATEERDPGWDMLLLAR